jgi:hypothetical protein
VQQWQENIQAIIYKLSHFITGLECVNVAFSILPNMPSVRSFLLISLLLSYFGMIYLVMYCGNFKYMHIKPVLQILTGNAFIHFICFLSTRAKSLLDYITDSKREYALPFGLMYILIILSLICDYLLHIGVFENTNRRELTEQDKSNAQNESNDQKREQEEPRANNEEKFKSKRKKNNNEDDDAQKNKFEIANFNSSYVQLSVLSIKILGCTVFYYSHSIFWYIPYICACLLLLYYQVVSHHNQNKTKSTLYNIIEFASNLTPSK